MTDSIVECPIEDCNAEWNATTAALDAAYQCPGCGNGWPEFHDAVDPDAQLDPEDVEIVYPFDAPGGVKT